jgi:hypothetical protein
MPVVPAAEETEARASLELISWGLTWKNIVRSYLKKTHLDPGVQ